LLLHACDANSNSRADCCLVSGLGLANAKGERR